MSTGALWKTGKLLASAICGYSLLRDRTAHYSGRRGTYAVGDHVTSGGEGKTTSSRGTYAATLLRSPVDCSSVRSQEIGRERPPRNDPYGVSLSGTSNLNSDNPGGLSGFGRRSACGRPGRLSVVALRGPSTLSFADFRFRRRSVT